MTDTRTSPIRPAGTAILLRDGSAGLETLLVQRGRALVFHGGAWVFPGGRVEPADCRDGGDEVEAARAAAARETREEAGLAVAAASLVPLSHWLTPPGGPRRFAAWFFVTRALEGDVQVDGRETQTFRWTAPAAALAARACGDIQLPPATFVSLVTLASARCVDEALAQARSHAPPRFVPRVCEVEDGKICLYGGDAGYEVGDPQRPGPRHRLWMLGSGWRYELSA